MLPDALLITLGSIGLYATTYLEAKRTHEPYAALTALGEASLGTTLLLLTYQLITREPAPIQEVIPLEKVLVHTAFWTSMLSLARNGMRTLETILATHEEEEQAS